MKIYLVGGAVRDKLLNLEFKDKDYVVTGSTPKQMLDLGFKQVGKDFPVFLHPQTHEEYALARLEKKSGHGYTQFTCDFSPEVSLQEDLKRRDLTINALAEDEKGNIIDYYHGIDDLNAHVLRHVSEAFSEDPLRVLRVARFAAKLHCLNFTIAQETLELMRKMSAGDELNYLTPERVFIELQKALMTPNPEVFIQVLHEVGALSKVLPEVENLFGVPGPKRWHPEVDTGIHTLMTVQAMVKENTDPVARFAMLCHDLGKALTPKSEWPHHPMHNILGLQPLEKLCTRLHVPNEYYETAKIVVRYHNDMHHIYKDGASGVLDLFERLDAFRKENRFVIFVQCCKCDFLGRKGFENRKFARSDYILEIFNLCKEVKALEFVQAGYKGAEIKEQIHNKRLKIIDKYLQKLPYNEIHDIDNEQEAII